MKEKQIKTRKCKEKSDSLLTEYRSVTLLSSNNVNNKKQKNIFQKEYQ